MPMSSQYPYTAVRAILTGANTYTTTIIVILVDFYGTEFLTWTPETIRMETEQDFGIKWPIVNFDRLMAGVALLTSNSFYKSLPDFIDLCNVLSGSPATPGEFDPADSTECAWGITEAILLGPPEQNDKEPFTDEIRAYIGKVLEMEGILVPPDILRICIQDTDHKARAQGDFSNDPEMYNAIWDSEAEKTEDINSLVKGRLSELVNQLASLQLRNGHTAEIAKKMLTNLNSHPTGGSPLS